MGAYVNTTTNNETPGVILESAPGVQAGIVGNPLLAALPGGTGSDNSANAPSALITLATQAANANRVGFYVQNQSAATIQIQLVHATGNNTIILVAPGGGTNQQGADWSMEQAGIRHTGQILICGASGSQFAAAEY